MGDSAASPPDGRRLRWAQHRARRRAAFVEAGVRTIDRDGPAASAEQIADEAGVSRTVLYRYFRDLEDLRQAIGEHVVDAVVSSVVPSLVLSPQATPRQIIGGAIEVIIGWLDEHPNLYFFLRGRRVGPSLDAMENTLADKVAVLLKMFLVSFGLSGDEAEPGAYSIVGLVESTGAWWLATRTMSRERITDFVCTSVWHLIEGITSAANLEVGYDDPLSISWRAQTRADHDDGPPAAPTADPD
jgi:AcrR family transcriptional regulator